TSRFRLRAGGAVLGAAAGGGDLGGSLQYADADNLTKDEKDLPSLKDKPSLKGKPRLQAAVRQSLAHLFGEAPNRIRVPAGLPIEKGGLYLGSRFVLAEEEGKAQPRPMAYHPGNDPSQPLVRVEGGYSLYRRHCLHCHGTTGDGSGPTADYLWPRPRDYRPGKFKFTSTPGNKPTRADLRKTILQGIPNTSMPSFEAQMTAAELEQVIDYLIFLSARGETELGLINQASVAEDEEAETALSEDVVRDTFQVVADAWKNAEAEVLQPPPRVPVTPESIERGRRYFLGEKGLECAGCHGAQADGNGPSFIDYATFEKYVFHEGADPARFDKLREIAEKQQKRWGDDWGNPIRPADLRAGIYKGGRRPIDIYWRIANGIHGTPMPAHSTNFASEPERIWDIVNFVLALPYEKDLLKDAKPISATSPAAVATR
ncbi:MAG: cytochrome c, partial [Isosphaeraceae bacterium]|nr:cytochrome c [Isosphaeraceae bacterium]